MEQTTEPPATKANEWEEWEDELRQIISSHETGGRPSVTSTAEISVASETPKGTKSTSIFKKLKFGLSAKEPSSSTNLIDILNSDENCQKLAALAKEAGLEQNVNYYKAQKEVEALGISINGLVQLQLFKKMIRSLAKDYLSTDSEFKLNLPAELLATASDAIKNCGQNTFGNKADVSFLQPINEQILEQLNLQVMPLYKKKEKEALKKPSQNTSKVSAKPAKVPSNGKRRASIDMEKLEPTIENLILALDTPSEATIIVAILKKQLCMENFEYYQKQLEVKNYSLTATNLIQQQTLKKMIKDIGKEFILPQAASELNISSKIRGEFMDAIKENNVQLAILEPVTKEVLGMLLQNTFPIYKRLKTPLKQ